MWHPFLMYLFHVLMKTGLIRKTHIVVNTLSFIAPQALLMSLGLVVIEFSLGTES